MSQYFTNKLWHIFADSMMYLAFWEASRFLLSFEDYLSFAYLAENARVVIG